MIEWIVKKVICSKVNDLLKKYKDNVGKVKDTLKTWILRIQKMMSCLEALLSKLDDNELTSDEVKQTTDEVTKLIKEW
jgi:hypothetical protein